MTPPRLSVEELAELQIRAKQWPLSVDESESLLAMAAELVRTESLMNFLAHHKDLFDLWHESGEYRAADPHHAATAGDTESALGALRTYAVGIGWHDPTTPKEGG